MAHGSFPIEGEVVDEETVAKGLGFVDVEAYRFWHNHKDWNRDNMLDFLLSEIANLRSQLKSVADTAACAERTAIYGVRIGGDQS